MEKQPVKCIEFDYTSFLGTSGSKKWTFVEAFCIIAPVFGVMWKRNIAELTNPEDRLWDAALKSMSSRQSDEANLVKLVGLAQYEGISELRIVMPYALEAEQIDYIEAHSKLKVDTSEQDILTLKL
ncbi:transporter [Vibrio sp. CAU 1672]|uniref:transporter n=1 Tax=Vibrio sp. CAU 1672 TaxID=3032594 RepID=UPI0023DB54B7|nr:transporter [Vibrio sp. CAU 1672]MDF2152365.1 transporter [Vibrio sp. CAU 1672]